MSLMHIDEQMKCLLFDSPPQNLIMHLILNKKMTRKMIASLPLLAQMTEQYTLIVDGITYTTIVPL